jgi:hypothetical protein
MRLPYYRAIQHAARTMGLQKARLVSALHRTLIEIAFCYWHADLDGIDPSTVPGLSALRQRVLDLRTRLKGEPALTVATDDPSIDPPRTAPGD